MEGNAIFEPLRSLGVVCNSCPAVLFESGLQKFILVSTGFGYRIYDADKLQPTFNSVNLGDLVSALDCIGTQETVFVSLLSTKKLQCYQRHQLLWEQSMAKSFSNVLGVRVVGGKFIYVWSRDKLEVRRVKDGSLYSKVAGLEKCFPLGGIPSRSILCPIQGSRSVLLGCREGVLAVIDLAKPTHFYMGVRKQLIKHLARVNESLVVPSQIEDWAVDTLVHGGSGAGSGYLVACSSSRPEHYGETPALICAFDASSDEVVFSFSLLRDQLRATCLAVKDSCGKDYAGPTVTTDESQDLLERDLLYIGCLNGDVVVFDLAEERIQHVITRAHSGASETPFERRRKIHEEVSLEMETMSSRTTNDTMSSIDSGADSDSEAFSQHKQMHMRPAPATRHVERLYAGGVRSIAAAGLGGAEGALILTSGTDNSLIVWHMINMIQKPLVLKSRTGFSGEINHLEFYDLDDEAKEFVVTSNEWNFDNNFLPFDTLPQSIYAQSLGFNQGAGQLGKISYIRAAQDLVYPQKKALHKLRTALRRKLKFLPAVTNVSFSKNRHFDWPAVVSTHQNWSKVMVWSVLNKSLMPVMLEVPYRSNKQKKSSDAYSSLPFALAELSRLNKHGDTATTFTPSPAVGVSVSECGHFVVVGYKDGSLHHFNLQSRRHVGTFVRHQSAVMADTPLSESLGNLAIEVLHETNPLKMTKKRKALGHKLSQLAESKEAKQATTVQAHDGSVAHVRILHSSIVYSASSSPSDLRICSWELLSKELTNTIDIAALLKNSEDENMSGYLKYGPGIRHFSVEGNSLLVGLGTVNDVRTSAESGSSLVLLLDRVSGRLLRRLGPTMNNVISHMELSPDGEWLLSSCWRRDGSRLTSDLKVYDIQSTKLIEWIRYPAPLTTFTMHPSCTFLVTAHVPPVDLTDIASMAEAQSVMEGSTQVMQQLLFPCGGLHVWVNLCAFGKPTDVVKRTTGLSRPRLMNFPPLSNEDDLDLSYEEEVNADEGEDKEADVRKKLPAAFNDPSRITLSNWTPQRIQTLLDWDKIKAANAPVSAPEKPEAEPFFLFDQTTPFSFFDSTLPTTPETVADELDLGDDKEDETVAGESAASIEQKMRAAVELVVGERATAEALSLLSTLESSSIPRIYRCLHSVGLSGGGTLVLLSRMLKAFAIWVAHNVRAEFVQALIKTFLSIHGQELVDALCPRPDSKEDEREEGLEELRLEILHSLNLISSGCRKQWGVLGNHLDALICFIKFSTLLQLD